MPIKVSSCRECPMRMTVRDGNSSYDGCYHPQFRDGYLPTAAIIGRRSNCPLNDEVLIIEASE